MNLFSTAIVAKISPPTAEEKHNARYIGGYEILQVMS